MPEPENRFTRMMQVAREHQADKATQQEATHEQEPPQEQPPTPTPRRTASKGVRGRPATGKRSDPDYESTTVFLRRDTKTAAGRLLLGDKHQDLSDVLEKLLAGWVRRNLQL